MNQHTSVPSLSRKSSSWWLDVLFSAENLLRQIPLRNFYNTPSSDLAEEKFFGCASMTCGVIHRLIIASCIPPLGFFSQVGLSQDFWISLVIYPFAVNGLYFRLVASHCDKDLCVILSRK